MNTNQYSIRRLLLITTGSAVLLAIAVKNPVTAKSFALHFLQFLPAVPVIAFFTWASKRRLVTFAIVSLAALFGFSFLQGATKNWLTPPTFSQLFWFDVKTVAGMAIALATFFGTLELTIPNARQNFGPPCPSCGHRAKSKLAQQCLQCGEDWHRRSGLENSGKL